MPDYIAAAIETDPAALAEESFDDLAARVPGWEPHPAEPDTQILEETSAMAAEVRDVASESTEDIFMHFGASLVNLPPDAAVAATVASTWVAPDAAGYTIEEGWAVGLRAAGDELVQFVVQDTVVIPPGSAATAAGAVTLVSQEETASANGLGGPGIEAELVEAVNVDFTITTTALSDGGQDAEEPAAYRNRLARELALQTPRPILPDDFAVLARRIAEVHRALAIDLYKPAGVPLPGDPEETNRPRSVTVAVVKEDGTNVSAGGKAAVDALLQAMREWNFEVWVIDPTRTPVNVTWTGTAYPGWNPAEVQLAGDAALAAYLDPATFGQDPGTEEPTWIRDLYVRYGELYEVLNAVPGLWRVDSLALSKNADPVVANANVLLAGVAPLPEPGAINGAVVAP